jgi:hypothetical protein
MTHNSNKAVTSGALLSHADDLAWLRSTHLAGMSVAPFKSFVIVGHESSPDAVYLYKDADPLVSDSFVVIDFSEVTA